MERIGDARACAVAGILAAGTPAASAPRERSRHGDCGLSRRPVADGKPAARPGSSGSPDGPPRTRGFDMAEVDDRIGIVMITYNRAEEALHSLGRLTALPE